MPSVPSQTTIAYAQRELDRNRAEAVIRRMRWDGLTLRLSHEGGGSRWCLSDGRSVPRAVAAIVIADVRICGVGDTLFSELPSQTFHYVK
jgi:hypothetical protein